MTNSKHVPKRRFKEFELDGEWEQNRLEEVAKFNKGKGYSKSDLQKKGSPIILYGRLYTKYETVISEVDTFTFIKENSVLSKGGEVLVPSSGESSEDISRASVVLNEGVILGGDLNIIKLQRKIEPVFLSLAISNGNQKKELSRRAQGKSVVHLNNDDLKQVSVLAPTENEQKKISNFFSVLDKLITLHQHKLDKLKNLKKAYLSEMFPAEGERVPKRRFPGFEGEWEQTRLGDIAERFDNLRVPVASKDRVSGTIPYYGANGIQDYVDGFTHNGEFVLLAEDGANDLKNYPVHYVKGKIWVNNHAHVIQGKEDLIDNQFLLFAVKQIQIEPYLVGGGRAKLNADIMMDLPLIIPEISEQKSIGSFLMTLDKRITLQQQKLDKLNDLKKAYLNELFV